MSILHDRAGYVERFGDPATWSGDWRRPGNYLGGDQQRAVHARLQSLERFLIGMAIRRHPSSIIGAVLCVSRIAVNKRRRALGLSLPLGRKPGATRQLPDNTRQPAAA